MDKRWLDNLTVGAIAIIIALLLVFGYNGWRTSNRIAGIQSTRVGELTAIAQDTKTIRTLTAQTKADTLAVRQLVLTIDRIVKLSEKPSRINESIIFQLCRADNTLANRPICRIP